jgi:hypothetical protein
MGKEDKVIFVVCNLRLLLVYSVWSMKGVKGVKSVKGAKGRRVF